MRRPRWWPINVDGQHLRTHIETNARFGALDDVDGRGRTVLTGTDANHAAREHLVDQMEDAGLDVRVDAVGNIAGRWTSDTTDSGVQSVTSGSHLDSVPAGGILDGPLGVYAALEAVQTFQDNNADVERPIEVVCFTEEGGRFANGVLGSSVAAGVRSTEEAFELTDGDGVTLASELERIGFRGGGRLDASDWNSWFELHIEQGLTLESAGLSAGIVTTISGVTHCRVRIEGDANHAGTTPMAERTDPLAAAGEFILDVERSANELAEVNGETTVATVGEGSVDPNVTNIVPGRVELGIDARNVDRGSVTELIERAKRSLSLASNANAV